MPLAVNDIIEMTAEQFVDSSVVLNTFHFRCITAPSTGRPDENLTALADHLWNNAGGIYAAPWGNCMRDGQLMRRIKMQVIAPTRQAYVIYPRVANGAVDSGGFDTANLSWVIVRQADIAGRRGHSTLHLVVPALGWISGGFLAVDGAAARNALRDVLPLQITVTAGGVYEPVIYHPNFSPNFSRITHAVIQDEVRTMSRRTVGRGI